MNTKLTASVFVFFLGMIFFVGAGRVEAMTVGIYPLGNPSLPLMGTFTIDTDKASYEPGENITITGSFSVTFQIGLAFPWRMSAKLNTEPAPSIWKPNPYRLLISTDWSGSGGRTVVAPATPGEYVVNGFITGGAFGGYSGSITLPIRVANPIVGTIDVSSNIPTSWTIAGPTTLSGSGITVSYTDQPVGTYTIIWNPVSGYVTPVSQSLSNVSNGDTISFIGNYISVSGVDLIAGPVTPITAIANSSTIFSSTISNIGMGSTGISSLSFFQVASGPGGTGTVTDLPSSIVPVLGTGGSAPVSVSHTFSLAGTYSMRACADAILSLSLGGGVITETNEENNCGPWTDITVLNAPPSISFAINGSTGPLLLFKGDTEIINWTVSDATSCVAISSDKWSGSKDPASGTDTQSAATTSDFTLECTGPGGTASETVHADVSCAPSTGTWRDCDCATETKSRTRIDASCSTWMETQECTTDEKNACRDFNWREVRP